MSTMSDFVDTELDTIRNLLQMRFRHTVDIHLADAQLRLDPSSDDLTECPAVYWRALDCNFVVIKTGVREFRCQFFYEPTDHYGTNRDKYNDLAECVSALLQVQADSERERQGVTSGSTGKDL